MSKTVISKLEEVVLKFWQENKIFEKSLEKNDKKKSYTFYDGPPFATGLPHYGHIVGTIMKDAIPRFWTMRGFYVERRWGWDCHGLPIENIVEQDLKLKTKQDIEEMGIDKFNETARKTVLRYADEWKKFIPRIGRWVDMENDYKTMEPTYMESIWWVFKTLWDKDLIYQGYKSMHICPRCDTTLSNFEVTQGYKDITDLSVVAKFELVDEPGTFVLAWTTTPWTLPGNAALAMREKIKYIKVESEGQKYIIAKDNLETIFKDQQYKELEKVSAKDLEGKTYKPLFDYFVNAGLDYQENIYTIQLADFVSVEDGTGVVHIAPGFGEDDMNLGRDKKLPTILHVTSAGKFTDEVKDFAGELVKPKGDPAQTDEKVVEYLEKKGLVFKSEKFAHSYPFCWRCDTPLLNYSTSSWFVKVTKIKKDLIKNNQKIHWVPEHLRDGRFGRWLEEAKDWAISRQRFWGTPLPIWQCECGENIVMGSIQDLEKASGEKVTDLHKHFVDKIEIKCQKCQKQVKRIPDVLDCWFESGSMPYAQYHYPFANTDKFDPEKGINYPAEFIAEGVDQTRGWFYTMLVISTALFNKPAYLNVIANGIVLAGDGQKMSKRLKNYPEPETIIEKYGADAMRYYLLTSPVMKAGDLNFAEEGVVEVYRKLIMLWQNIFSFYQTYADQREVKKLKSKHVLDRWILARLNQLIEDVTKQMENYDLVKASRPIQEFVNEFSTWYLRRSRSRFKGDDQKDKQDAINATHHVLVELCKIAAPFTPFISEYFYRQLVNEKESVHLQDWPKADKKLIDDKLLKEMEEAKRIVEAGLASRAEAGIKVRQVLSDYCTCLVKDLNSELAEIVCNELNIKELTFGEKEDLDTTLTPELKLEGQVRELIRQINLLRKEEGLTIKDQIEITYEGDIDELVKKHGGEIKKQTLTNQINSGTMKSPKVVKIDNIELKLKIKRI
ncbi:isoleucine--tRNA ligase [Patescibacteria group bacterium]|nr:isoleucine--tRNA ligase [Patescibacteria group bacterium]